MSWETTSWLLEYVAEALRQRWSARGPWRLVTAARQHLYEVQSVISGETQEIHVVRLRFYADSSLDITADVKDVFHRTFHQGEFELKEITEPRADGKSCELLVSWVGFKTNELGNQCRPSSKVHRNLK